MPNFSCTAACLECDALFKDSPVHMRTRKFCSQKCYGKAKRILALGDQNSKWRGGIPEKLCNECGTLFRSYTKTQKYCSRICSTKNGKPMNIRSRLAFEYKLLDIMEKDGWMCLRSAGSRGPADIVALKTTPYELRFIQVKTTSKSRLLKPDNLSTFVRAARDLIAMRAQSVTYWLYIKVMRGPWITIQIPCIGLPKSEMRTFLKQELEKIIL